MITVQRFDVVLTRGECGTDLVNGVAVGDLNEVVIVKTVRATGTEDRSERLTLNGDTRHQAILDLIETREIRDVGIAGPPEYGGEWLTTVDGTTHDLLVVGSECRVVVLGDVGRVDFALLEVHADDGHSAR